MCWRCVQGLLPYGFVFAAIGLKGSWRIFSRKIDFGVEFSFMCANDVESMVAASVDLPITFSRNRAAGNLLLHPSQLIWFRDRADSFFQKPPERYSPIF